MNDLTKSERLRSFILENVDSLEFEAFYPPFDEVPDFELHARDYLQYAKEEIDRGADINLIDCISNLKRALDCQVDSYLHTFNLLALVRGKNLGIDKKLEFLSKVGIFSSRSLSRFNTIRNKIEHEYKAPHIEDIDVYFDLISAFASILERATLIHSGLEGLDLFRHRCRGGFRVGGTGQVDSPRATRFGARGFSCWRRGPFRPRSGRRWRP